MAERGVRTIVINGRNAERGERARRDIASRAPDASVTFVKADVSRTEGARELFHAVEQLFDAPLEVLVNSTGGDFSPELFHRTPVEDLDGVVRHWLSSRIHCCHAALPLMTAGGAIVNVGSDAAKVPTPGEAVIGAAMAGMAMFSRTLAMEAKRQGIRVNVVTPSVVEGPRLRARIAAGGFGAKLFEKAAAAAHLGMATPLDVAEVIVFLASPQAADDRSGHQRQRRDLGGLMTYDLPAPEWGAQHMLPTIRRRRLGTVLVVVVIGLAPALTRAADPGLQECRVAVRRDEPVLACRPALAGRPNGVPQARGAGTGIQAKQSDPAVREWIQLFNGRDLADWTIKFAKHDLGENVRNTFRVEDGFLKVRYDEWPSFNGEFGHIFYKDPYSYYLLAAEYRFVGDQVPGGPGWAIRNNGLMLHSPHPRTMLKDQDFPIALEIQLLGGLGKGPRTTANLCTPGSHVVFNGKLHTAHCTNSTSQTYEGDQWVRVEVLVHGDELVRHMVDGQTVLEYSKPQIGGGQVAPVDPAVKVDGTPMAGGYISLQAETAPVDFRKVELVNLEGCSDARASNYKSYIVKSNPAMCR